MDFNKYPGVAFETSGYFVRSDKMLSLGQSRDKWSCFEKFDIYIS